MGLAALDAWRSVGRPWRWPGDYSPAVRSERWPRIPSAMWIPSAARIPSPARIPSAARIPSPARIPSAVWIPFLASRILVWVTGVLAMVVEGQYTPYDPTGATAHLGHTANILVAPAVRWDAVWYLYIARHGYASRALASFFPLYPLTTGGLSWSTGSAIVAGVVISVAAFLVALLVVHRLVELDFGPAVAGAAVWLLALFPMSYFFSAVYTESLFLALSAGSIYQARRGRWFWAGLLGGLAAATRSVGLLLVVPLVILHVQTGRRARPARPDWRRGLWILLVPAGLGAYVIGLGIARGTPFAMFNARQAGRGLVFPVVTIIRQFRWTANTVGHFLDAGHNAQAALQAGIPELAFLALAVVCAVGVIRRLDLAYALYAGVALVVLLCEPYTRGDPLASFPRYILVLFPLWIWLAVVTSHRRIWKGILAASGLLLILFTARFATWHFVA